FAFWTDRPLVPNILAAWSHDLLPVAVDGEFATLGVTPGFGLDLGRRLIGFLGGPGHSYPEPGEHAFASPGLSLHPPLGLDGTRGLLARRRVTAVQVQAARLRIPKNPSKSLAPSGSSSLWFVHSHRSVRRGVAGDVIPDPDP